MKHFKSANSKLQKLEKRLAALYRRKIKVYSFGTLSGHTCHAAKDCLAWVQYREKTRDYKLVDGPDATFRCFAASAEAVYTGAYNHRFDNMVFVRSFRNRTKLALELNEDLPENADFVRLHDAGDIENATEFKAWCHLADIRPDVVFYGYTKMLPLWLKYRHLVPENMVLTASRGGKYDDMISEHKLREAVVVFSESEAMKLGLQLDQDDSSAARPDKREISFALLIHGQGAAGSKQARIMADNRKKVTA